MEYMLGFVGSSGFYFGLCRQPHHILKPSALQLLRAVSRTPPFIWDLGFRVRAVSRTPLSFTAAGEWFGHPDQ